MQGDDLVSYMVRTRIAPSPTGYPHIGTIYQALFDFAYAKKENGKFVVRIEDTDQQRLVQDAEQKIYEALAWFSLNEDESPRKGGPFRPYKQSERLHLYSTYAEQLLQSGHAYYCFCSKERLEEMRKKQQERKQSIIMYDKHCRYLSPDEIAKNVQEGKTKVIRLKVPEGEKIVAHDEIRGDIIFDTSLIDDQVLLKADGFPTYHLAVVVDDHLMEISHVVRAEEWLPSFPKHVLVYRFLGWNMPKFFHTAALRNPDKSKLSKRQGHTNVSWYQEEGYLPEAILNYIALLGWSHPAEKEIFSLREFITLFDLWHIRPIGPIFDLQKLQWINGEYLRQMSHESFKSLLINFYKKDPQLTEIMTHSDWNIDLILMLAKTRIKTLKELKDLIVFHSIEYSENEKGYARELKDAFEKSSKWNKEIILTILRESLQKHSIKMNVLYKILTGKDKGLPLPEFLESIGKKETLHRLTFSQ